jgi:polyisoprenoid-binding protein YceI
MHKKFVYSGIATAALVLIGLAGLSFVSSARTPNFEERFGNLAVHSETVTKEEQNGTYSFDKAHSYIGFRVRHMGLVDVPGSFTDFKGDVRFDPNNVKNSTVEFTAQMKSVDTRVNARDNHLRSKDFFEVDTYPEMTFKSTEVKKKGKRYFLVGDLTMKGVTKQVTIPFKIYGPMKDERGTVRMGISGSTNINRREFNVNYGGNLPDGTATLSDNIVVDLQIESVKQKEQKEDTAGK